MVIKLYVQHAYTLTEEEVRLVGEFVYCKQLQYIILKRRLDHAEFKTGLRMFSLVF